MTDNNVHENVRAEETEAKHVKDEGGVLADIAEGVKRNWWKVLIGAVTTIGSFALGYEMGSKPEAVAPNGVGEDEAPFDTGEAE